MITLEDVHIHFSRDTVSGTSRKRHRQTDILSVIVRPTQHQVGKERFTDLKA
jgi:hypothetical protein